MRYIDEKDVALLRVVEGLRTAFEWVPYKSILEKLPYSERRIKRRLIDLERMGLIRVRYVSYYGQTSVMILEKGFDTLALWDFKKHGVISMIGDVVGEGKEAVIAQASSPSGETLAIKFHRYWAKEFQHIRRSLNYAAVKIRGEELNIDDSNVDIPRAKAQVEMKVLTAAYQAGIKVPKPYGLNRHAIAMKMILGKNGLPSPQLVKVKLMNPKDALEQILIDMETLVKEAGFIHGDLNEYNILVSEEGDLYYIDFPQSVPKSYSEAKKILSRDLKNITTYFRRKYKVKTPNVEEATKNLLG